MTTAPLERTTPAGTAELADIADLARYPLDVPGSASLGATVARCRAALADEGCALLPAFVRADCHDALRAESESLASRAHFCHQQVNAYATAEDGSLPADDPRRHFETFTNGFVTRDRIPETAMIQRLFRNKAFQRFVAACLGLDEIHEYADPMAGLVINVMPDGTTLPWHFDTNEFIVSLMTRPAEAGGLFEYCPGLRRPADENLPGVKAVLKGDRRPVRTLDLCPGDLQIFQGRFSLHRVAPVEGERHTVLFGYARTPGMIGRVERTRKVYGRVLPAHLEAERQRRADGLLD